MPMNGSIPTAIRLTARSSGPVACRWVAQPHLGGITLRLSDEDFAGVESPDGLIRVADSCRGSGRGLRRAGEDAAGPRPARRSAAVARWRTQEPLPLTTAEQRFAAALRDQLALQVIHSRGFGPHQPERDGPWPRSSSRGSTLPQAMATGRCRCSPGICWSSWCWRTAGGRAKGAVVVDQANGNRRTVVADLVVLCASTIQTLAILLRSREQGLKDPSRTAGYTVDGSRLHQPVLLHAGAVGITSAAPHWSRQLFFCLLVATSREPISMVVMASGEGSVALIPQRCCGDGPEP
ncbi:MAG: hypothetical protein CM15mP77_0760 [Synechococcus sp.]|nr:MAG: hypothetical protein CM15mP77_0760 [Synechococcus sp.]